MLKQRRQGYLLLFFTLFFILLCLTQRMSGAPRISLSPSADFTTPVLLSDTETGSANPGGTCDISAKSLSTVPQFPAEPLFFALLFLRHDRGDCSCPLPFALVASAYPADAAAQASPFLCDEGLATGNLCIVGFFA